ncbi:hypothetical protein PHSY_005300 [Pseudozyma hubeiensis SY62]|uniref:Micro-fibrillar-associated protein 1 C-terminal domain-containing protein n=1 Tax=Pseudozyma hubeiensis (strain SY62) TaxID=1305764 RepID=R9P8K1_PSEHS|nr:hypothetical protein PHSY_005300 [Pseudozyma hubeiensis SY62]GAC97713.1 hypothetical protein PHSY_005300 [Pseudozyma hubeiensis SY62]
MAPPPPPKVASRVARPAARYRPGKAPSGAGAALDEYSDSDASDREDEQPDTRNASAINIADLSLGSAQQRRTAGIVINDSKKLDLRLNPASITAADDGEQDSSEYETDTDQDEESDRPVFRKPGAPASAPQQQPEATDSSEYETDSEEETDEDESTPAPLLKPIFVPKSARTTISTTTSADQQQPADDLEAKAEALAAQRRKEAHDLAEATIKRQLAEKEYQESHIIDFDDTDGLDPEAEFQAWRQRELARLRRDHEAVLAKQREQQETDAFKSLPEAEKERLGRERAAQSRAEKKEQRGNPAFLQKYYHKGSFFQDMDILKRDYSEKTTKDVDVSKLPKMMQVRGYGVKGRSKWTHLANEDTSKGRMQVERLGSESGCFRCGGPHLKKDCPEVDGKGEGGSGANSSALASEGSRRWGSERADDTVERREAEDSQRQRSRSPPRRGSSRYDAGASSSREPRHRSPNDDRSHRDHKHRSSTHTPSSSHRRDDDTSRSHRHSRDDRKERTHRRDSDRQDDHHHHRSSHRDRDHRSNSSRHRSSDSHDKHKRRDLDDHTSTSRHDDRESHRKRSRLKT